MAKRRSTTADDLAGAIEQELTLYHTDVTAKVDALSRKAAKGLVEKTKATAPVGHRGSFRANIAWKLLRKSKNGSAYVWHVRKPDHRLTHLLVHGHATRDGGRTRGNSFLADACAEVLPAYEEQVEEVLRNG